MRHRYLHLDPDLLRELLSDLNLRRLFNQLILASGGDVEQAKEWMRYLQEQGYLPESSTSSQFFEALAEEQVIGKDEAGDWQLTSVGERPDQAQRLRRGLRRPAPRRRRLPRRAESRRRHRKAARNAALPLRRRPGPPRRRAARCTTRCAATRARSSSLEDDLEVHETEHLTNCATIVAIDISHSMVLYGEDRITPPKRWPWRSPS